MTLARKKNNKKFGNIKKKYYLCTRFSHELASERAKVDYSAASANLARKQLKTNENQDSVHQH